MIPKNPMSLETQEQAPPLQAGLLTGDNLTVWEGDFMKPYVRKAATARDAMAALRIACRGTEERYKDKLEKKEMSIKQKENETLDDYGQRFVACKTRSALSATSWDTSRRPAGLSLG